MKFPMLLVVMLLLGNPPARAGFDTLEYRGYTFSTGGGQQTAMQRAGIYRTAISMRSDWVGMTRDFSIGDSFTVGLGIHVGGPTIEWQTTPSPVGARNLVVDPNDWLAVKMKMDFAEIMPFTRIGYRYIDRRERLELRVDAGFRLLLVDDISLRLDGRLGRHLAGEDRFMRSIARDIEDRLEDYYLEPILSLRLRYRFS